MALKTRKLTEAGSGIQVISPTSSVSYSWSAEVWRDDLVTSVNDSPGGEHPFESYHRTLLGSYCNTLEQYKPPRVSTGKWVVVPGPSSFGNTSFGKCPPVTWDSANLWARTNPSRPNVLLPVFWVELREVPDMLRQAGRFLLAGKNWRRYVRTRHQTRDLATANLAFQFGWAPLIGDLWKIAQFQDAVDKRRKVIDKLYSGKGLRMRISLGGSNDSPTPPATGSLSCGTFENFAWGGTAKINRNAHAWAVLRWKPTSPSSLPPSDLALRGYLTGVHPSHILTNVWEGLPWSWLIDYFTNIGDVIQAGNHHLATPAGGCVMTQYTTTTTHPKLTSSNGRHYLGPGTLIEKWNFREVVASSPSFSARIPTLGAGQLSVLSSLAFLKGRKPLGLTL